MNPSVLTAAQELAGVLPSPTPLRVAGPATEPPAEDAQAVVATFVGGQSAEVVVVPHESVAAALAEAGGLSLAEALRPALEAAVSILGAGVLSTAELRTAGEVVSGSGMELVALESEGRTQAWFGMAVRGQAADPAGLAPAPQGVAQPAARVPAQHAPGAAQAARFPTLGGGAPLASQEAAMRVLYDVEMVLTVEIGRTRLPVREVLELMPGTVLELDRSAGAPADIMVNGRLVARGEIVVVDDEYAVRVSEIVSGVDGML